MKNGKKIDTRTRILRYAELVFEGSRRQLSSSEKKEMLEIESCLMMTRTQLLEAAEKQILPEG